MMHNEQQQRSDNLYEQHVTHLTLQGKRQPLLMVIVVHFVALLTI